MPALREAFEAGEVRVEHVDAIAYRAIPSRIDVIAEHDATLARLAIGGEPKHVATAVQRIVDHVDRDGADEPTRVRPMTFVASRYGKALQGWRSSPARRPWC